MYEIKIDKRTIKLNKYYGMSTIRIPYGKKMTVWTTKKIKNKNFQFCNMEVKGNSKPIYTYENYNTRSIIAWDRSNYNNKDVIKMSMDILSEEYNTMTDQRKYNYLYCNPTVICNDCKKKFKFKQLVSEDNDDGYEIMSDACPFCQSENCIEYKYQNISEVKK
jgi:hypothetical protein